MSGDYTRFTFDPRKRYSGVLMQQGRVQLDSDWNEEIDILRRRIRTTTLDILGPLGVPYVVSPGRLQDRPDSRAARRSSRSARDASMSTASRSRPSPRMAPPTATSPSAAAARPLPLASGRGRCRRLSRRLGSRSHLYRGSGAARCGARRRRHHDAAADGLAGARRADATVPPAASPVGEPPSAGRLTSRGIAPPAPDDPCILPPHRATAAWRTASIASRSTTAARSARRASSGRATTARSSRRCATSPSAARRRRSPSTASAATSSCVSASAIG